QLQVFAHILSAVILAIIVAVYALMKQRIRVTRNSSLTGAQAQTFGVLLVALMLAVREAFPFVLPFLPPVWTRAGVRFAILNAAALFSVFLTSALISKVMAKPMPQSENGSSQ